MAFRIQEFMSDVSRRGLAKQSNFEVIFSLPSNILGTASISNLSALTSLRTSSDLSLRCESIDFPGRGIQAVDSYRKSGFGVPINVPIAGIHLEVTATFLCTDSFYEKEIFETWQDLLVGDYRKNPSSTVNQFNPGYYDDYIKPCQMQISQYKETGEKTYEIELRELWPRTINPLQGSWSGGDQVHRLNVSFNYRYHVIKKSSLESQTDIQTLRQLGNVSGIL